MSRGAALTELARDDIREARRWYRSVHPFLERDFVRSVRTCVDRIVEFPDAHPVVHPNVRKALVGRFPYLVLYRYAAGSVVVIAVFHARRDPAQLANRLR